MPVGLKINNPTRVMKTVDIDDDMYADKPRKMDGVSVTFSGFNASTDRRKDRNTRTHTQTLSHFISGMNTWSIYNGCHLNVLISVKTK